MKRQWLKDLRQEKGMTGRVVAKEIGMSHNYYFEIENGLRNPSGNMALKIAKFYGFDMSLFFEEQEKAAQ